MLQTAEAPSIIHYLSLDIPDNIHAKSSTEVNPTDNAATTSNKDLTYSLLSTFFHFHDVDSPFLSQTTQKHTIYLLTVRLPLFQTHHVLTQHGFIFVCMLSPGHTVAMYVHHRHPEVYEIMRKYHATQNVPETHYFLTAPRWLGYFVTPVMVHPPSDATEEH